MRVCADCAERYLTAVEQDGPTETAACSLCGQFKPSRNVLSRAEDIIRGERLSRAVREQTEMMVAAGACEADSAAASTLRGLIDAGRSCRVVIHLDVGMVTRVSVQPLEAPPPPPRVPDWCECEEFGQHVAVPCAAGTCPTLAARLRAEATT